MKYLLSFLFCCAAGVSLAQPLTLRAIEVPLQYQNIFPELRTVETAADLHISLYYIGTLKRPRFMAQGPDGAIYVADMNGNHIYKLVDVNHDGVADTAVAVTPSVDSAHSFAFYHGDIYVAEPSRVRRFSDTDGDGFYETEHPFITGIGASGPYNHYTRTILIDSAAGYIYLTVGASCNACRETDPERATVLRFNLDGSGRTIYATGLRNALGIAKTASGQIWVANADRDYLGNEEPKEIVTHLDSGGFYGWPFAFDNRLWDDFSASAEYQSILPVTRSDSDLVASMKTPDLYLPAHSTPMQLVYDNIGGGIFGNGNGFYLAVHGSSPGGRTIATGYKLVRLYYDDTLEAWTYQDIVRGFLTDSINYNYWARPCGLVLDPVHKVMYLGSDVGTPVIFKITSPLSDAVADAVQTSAAISAFPNPSNGSFTIAIPSAAMNAPIELCDMLGRIIQYVVRSDAKHDGMRYLSIDIGNAVSKSVIFVHLRNNGRPETLPVVIR